MNIENLQCIHHKYEFCNIKHKYSLKLMKDTLIKNQKINIYFITYVEYYIEFVSNDGVIFQEYLWDLPDFNIRKSQFYRNSKS